MNKKSSLKNEQIGRLSKSDSWPHLPTGGQKIHSDSFRRVCKWVKKMDEYGMPAEDAVRMLSELYCCAYGDIQDMPKPEPQDDEPGVRYFDQYEIIFSLGA